MEIQELVGKLRVDKNNLDDELEAQPLLYWAAAQESAKAKERRELCKIELSLLIDEAVADIREDEPKMAESRALREAEADPTVMEKRRELAHYVRVESEWAALASAAGQKSHALTGLTTLYTNSYYVRDSARGRRRK